MTAYRPRRTSDLYLPESYLSGNSFSLEHVILYLVIKRKKKKKKEKKKEEKQSGKICLVLQGNVRLILRLRLSL